jgi:hypothetical protein
MERQPDGRYKVTCEYITVDGHKIPKGGYIHKVIGDSILESRMYRADILAIKSTGHLIVNGPKIVELVKETIPRGTTVINGPLSW